MTDGDGLGDGDGLFLIAGTLARLASVLGGYRKQLIDAGFSEDAAEQMAAAYHEAVINKTVVGGGQ